MVKLAFTLPSGGAGTALEAGSSDAGMGIGIWGNDTIGGDRTFVPGISRAKRLKTAIS